jgi:hypothetical protein
MVMRLKLLGMLLMFNAVAGMAQSSNPLSHTAASPGDAPASDSTSLLTPDGRVARRHPPRKIEPGTPEAFYDPIKHVTVSYNKTWAGYAVTGSNFNQVSGSWTVTPVDCTASPNSDSSQWVGIDGWTSDTVEQTGTDSDCDGDQPSYYVWYEFYPLGTRVISTVSIAPGDNFVASVVYKGNNLYTVAIKNTTTNQSFTKEVEFAGSRGATPEWNSAEWIMEMDGRKLSDFGTEPFGAYYTGIPKGNNMAIDSSVSGVISDFGAAVQESITTKTGSDGSTETSVPSALASDGSGFTVTWKAE